MPKAGLRFSVVELPSEPDGANGGPTTAIPRYPLIPIDAPETQH